MFKEGLFTSESTLLGHPDKIADQIAETVLDAYLRQDNSSRVSIEVVVSRGLVQVIGHITSKAVVDIPYLVRRKLLHIGYRDPVFGFDVDNVSVFVSIDRQSQEIDDGVTNSFEVRNILSSESKDLQGAGDSAFVFGFACKGTENLMPLPITLAHNLASKLDLARQTSEIAGLGPDGKVQVTVEYQNFIPVRIHAIVISVQYLGDLYPEDLTREINLKVIAPVFEGFDLGNTQVILNPSGSFIKGGPAQDTGLTGRKLEVDTYGGFVRHGGGSLSGKDPSKIDKSGTYMARYAAKNVVASGLASFCEIQVGFAIGLANPISILVNTFGTGLISDKDLAELVLQVFKFNPSYMENTLELRKAQYEALSTYGHLGRVDLKSAWERTDALVPIVNYLSNNYSSVSYNVLNKDPFRGEIMGLTLNLEPQKVLS